MMKYRRFRRKKYIPRRRRIYSNNYRKPPLKQVVNTTTINATHTIDVWNKTNTWQKLPTGGNAWIWDTNPTVMQAHLANVYCRNMFQTYKYKLLKKVEITFTVVRETLEQHEALELTFDDTQKKIKGELNNYAIKFTGQTLWYTENKTRYNDNHPDDIKNTTRNFKGQKYGKKFKYTWYPGCKQIINKNWDELAREDIWSKTTANITTMCDGISKCYEDGMIKGPPDIYMKTRSESYQRLYEITIKTYWNMWDMYKNFVEKPGVTFDNLLLNEKNFSSECGFSFPYDGHSSEIIRGFKISAKDLILKVKTEYNEYEIGVVNVIK